MTQARLELMFSGYCAVSGSPVNPHDYNRYRLTLPLVAGGNHTGYMHYCCWPCVCDTQDFIRIDTKTIKTQKGERQYHFAVLGNPCDHADELTKPFTQPFGRGKTTLRESAPEVRCGSDGVLLGATLSDHGYIIINMFFDAVTDTEAGPARLAGSEDARGGDGGEGALVLAGQEGNELLVPLPDPTPGRTTTSAVGTIFSDEREWSHHCEDRARNGYNSGMGEIFRKVAAISPIPLHVASGLDTAPAIGPGTTCEDLTGVNCKTEL